MSKGVSKQGQLANENGHKLERRVEKELAKYKINSIPYRKLKTKEGKSFVLAAKRGFLAKNVPYTNVFGSRAFGEFVLYLFGSGEIRIECRSQNVAGSVQDKLPKLLEDCKCMPENKVIIILDGEGFSHNAKNWLKNSALSIYHKDIMVMNFEEFKAWIRKELMDFQKVSSFTHFNSMIKNVFNKPNLGKIKKKTLSVGI